MMATPGLPLIYRFSDSVSEIEEPSLIGDAEFAEQVIEEFVKLHPKPILVPRGFTQTLIGLT